MRSITATARMGVEVSVVGLAYVERWIALSGATLEPHMWRRLLVVAWMLAAKMWDDECLENDQFAPLFKFNVADINRLEQQFVADLQYNLALSAAEYARYYFALRSICQTESQ